MKRLKGPELKMPELKVPQFLADVYHDMRDRRLLPVMALVVVAIAAVPFLLGDAEEVAPPPPSGVGAAEGTAVDASTLTVVEAKPGLRDYRKRLGRHAPTDPFVQRYTGLPKEAQLSSEVSSAVGGGESSGGSTTVEDTPSSGTTVPNGTSPDSGTGSQPGGSGGPDSLDGKQLFGFRPDVRFGVAGSGQLKLHEELPLGSLLPEKNAVVLFVGVTQNGQRALFNLVPGVMVRGNGDCVGGDESCYFLSMQEGNAVNLLTSTGQSFRLKVESIEFVELEVPAKAKGASGSAAAGRSGRGIARGLPAVSQFDFERR